MSSYKNIEVKLKEFISKYYTNELIKGSILFIAIGFLYFLFTVFIEHFLWLNTTARTFLFWSFIGVETFLFIRYIIQPISKILGFKKGISHTAEWFSNPQNLEFYNLNRHNL